MLLLMISDHKANQELLASMLRQQCHTYEIVENGQDAVNITAAKEYDLILMVNLDPTLYTFKEHPLIIHFTTQDCNMPIMDGWQVLYFQSFFTCIFDIFDIA
jgi:CheY-like chemotaxis protein